MAFSSEGLRSRTGQKLANEDVHFAVGSSAFKHQLFVRC